VSTQPHRLLTPEEYLAIERDVPTKHEFYRGEMFAMSGASREHVLIGGNIFAALHGQLANRPCEAYASDMRVKVSPTGLYTYPDVVVTCQKPRFEDKQFDTLLNPQVIFEVLSKSTENYDRGDKFEQFRQIDSLREYILVAQDRPHVEHYTRQESGQWLLADVSDMAAELHAVTIGCQIKLADVYAKVEFPPRAASNPAAGLFTDDESR
jgi:Uma2 family endonuclease